MQKGHEHCWIDDALMDRTTGSRKMDSPTDNHPYTCTHAHLHAYVHTDTHTHTHMLCHVDKMTGRYQNFYLQISSDHKSDMITNQSSFVNNS